MSDSKVNAQTTQGVQSESDVTSADECNDAPAVMSDDDNSVAQGETKEKPPFEWVAAAQELRHVVANCDDSTNAEDFDDNGVEGEIYEDALVSAVESKRGHADSVSYNTGCTTACDGHDNDGDDKTSDNSSELENGNDDDNDDDDDGSDLDDHANVRITVTSKW